MLGYSLQPIGSPLAYDDATYLPRQIDHDLLSAVQASQLCSVLGSPQMGKSSLCIRTRHQLKQQGYHCLNLRATQLIDSPQYYYRWDKQFVSALWDGLFPGEEKRLRRWLQESESLLPLQRLERFSRYVLAQPDITGPIVIFIDDIEALLDVPFLSNDLFEWIWHCFCLRKIYPAYQRLNFVITGNAQIHSLTQNEQLLVYNHEISPENFTLEEIAVLRQNIQPYIDDPMPVLEGIFRWTNGQPLLTSKLYQLIITHLKKAQENSLFPVSPLLAALDQWIDHTVQTCIIDTCWQQDDLSFLRDSWYQLNQSRYKKQLRDLYYSVLINGPVKLDSNPVQSELLLSGLATLKGDELCVGSEIYRHVFMPLF